MLFEPLRIGSLQTQNRVVYPPCGTYRSPDGEVANAHADILLARAQGGAGVVYLEALRVHPGSLPVGELSGFTESLPARLSPIVEAVHEWGSLLFT